MTAPRSAKTAWKSGPWHCWPRPRIAADALQELRDVMATEIAQRYGLSPEDIEHAYRPRRPK